MPLFGPFAPGIFADPSREAVDRDLYGEADLPLRSPHGAGK